MSFPRYPKYKASGVEWLGEVPEHWKQLPVWLLFEIGRGRVISHEEIIDNSGEYPVYSSQTENDGIMGCLDSFAFDGDYLTWTTDGANAGTVFRRSGKFNCTNVCGTLKARSPDVLLDYCCHALAISTASFVRHDINPKLMNNVMSKIRIPIPSIAEQTKIASFLDRETAKIDGLVGEQRRLIELLKEKRQAVISHAVTKGLNPHAPLKPSGIEWLGDVPEHWAVTKMKWVAKMESGHTPDKKIPEYWDDGDIPWVSLNDTAYLKDNDYISETAYTVTELGIANSSARLLPPRVVVFSRDATIGRCAITTRPMAVSQHFIAWVCRESLIPEYLLLRLRSMTQELDRLTTGATLKTIGMPDVRTLLTPVPPLEEQQAIIDWVSDETAKLDALTAEAERGIELLQERRTALISAAVTGQIDVRGLGDS